MATDCELLIADYSRLMIIVGLLFRRMILMIVD